MAQYTGYQSILNEMLGDYRDKGFRLVASPSSLELKLYYQDDFAGAFHSATITPDLVRTVCRISELLRDIDNGSDVRLAS